MTSHNRTERPAFIRRQYDFAAHIRDPEHRPAPADVEDRRMGIYRELFYNNVEGFIAGTFPVLLRILDDAAWHALIRDYFNRHRAHTPLFLEMPREFLNYLENERGEQPQDPPFLKELAHYEWVELALSVADERLEPEQSDPEGDLMTGSPVLSPLAWPLAYRYPVHRIGPDFQPDTPGENPTYLIVYRDRQDQVGFIEINPVTRRLLELIESEPSATGEELLLTIAQELSHPQPRVVVDAGREIFNSLHEKDIIPGTKRH